MYSGNDLERLTRLITVILLGWLALGCLWLGLERLPSSDDVMFLSVPKNWLTDYGWATSFSEKIPFNPDLTAGPTLLLPAALLMQVFGNTPWIAGITGALINLTLMVLCLRQIHRQWPHPAAMALIFVTLCISVKADDISSLIGYYTGSLLFFLACLLAFQSSVQPYVRAAQLGLLTALALHTKPLALPAFAALTLLFLLRVYGFQSTANLYNHQQSITRLVLLLVSLATPIAILHGGWLWWQTQALATYSAEFLQARTAYGDAFFLHHGSGIHEWQLAGDKLHHITRNINRNLFHLESTLAEYHLRNPFLGSAVADEQHWVGVGWILLITTITAISARRVLRNSTSHKNTAFNGTLAAIGLISLLYLGWFLCFAMAMSAGHAYFPVHWSLWLVALFVVAECMNNLQQPVAMPLIGGFCFLLITFLHPVSRNHVLFFNNNDIPDSESMMQAKRHLQQTAFQFPLAGCGYNGYPRHLEYLLPHSQNFLDCYNLIEDNAVLDVAAYRTENHLDDIKNTTMLSHFYQHVTDPGLQYRFTWLKPVNFTLVVSLHNLDNSLRFAPIINACRHHILYRNNDIVIMECRFEELQKNIDLNFMMSEIAINQRWYRTRLISHNKPE